MSDDIIYLAVAIMPQSKIIGARNQDRCVVDVSTQDNCLLSSFECKRWRKLYPETINIVLQEYTVCKQDLF